MGFAARSKRTRKWSPVFALILPLAAYAGAPPPIDDLAAPQAEWNAAHEAEYYLLSAGDKQGLATALRPQVGHRSNREAIPKAAMQ